MKVAVLGAGSWGTALASTFVENGHDTTIWARRTDLADEISGHQSNQRYLPGATLPKGLRAVTELEAAVGETDLIVIAVPSSGIRVLAQQISKYISDTGPILAHAVKGFDVTSKQRISQVLESETGSSRDNICVITGPSHAEEVIAHLPTTVVVASNSRSTAERVQDALMNQYLRVYTNPDVVGAELGGSLKNIIALAVGVAAGMGVGDNAKAALMTRGLAEIVRLGVKLGASPLTFAGLSGVGDLIVTCTSIHSRNFRAGRMLGQGKSLNDALTDVGMVVEGVQTTKIVVSLANSLNVEMPITQTLHDILFTDMSPADGVGQLMGRSRSHEIEEVAKEHLSPEWLSE